MARSPRSAQTRRADEHPMAATRYRGKLYVDQHKVKKGYTYRWVRESSRNEADPSNVTDAQINNWQPVPASLHPEMVPPALPGIMFLSGGMSEEEAAVNLSACNQQVRVAAVLRF